MVGVEGQFFISITIEGVGDFLGEGGAIIEFAMEEKVGGDVPAFTLKFKTTDATVISKFNEGAQVQVVFGKSMTDYKYAQMQVQKFDHNVDNSEFITINVKGIIQNGIHYLKDNAQKSYRDYLSSEVLEEVAKPYFEVVKWQAGAPQDTMTWVRPNHTPHRFLQDVWKRSYMGDDNALVYAIEMSGKFLITDIKMIAAQPLKWFLVMYGTDITLPNTAAYDPNYEIASDFGLLNNMVTNTKKTPIHSMNDGQAKEVVTPAITPVLINGPLNKMKDAPIKTEFQQSIDTDNFHDNYSKARLVTVPQTAMLNSLELNITIENKWQDYLLLDLIHFTPWKPKASAMIAEMQSIGGIYSITRISRFYANNRAGIKITISRDGMNNMSGSWF